ncbi:hypothetical protein EX405_19250 [Salmonella enterica]|nr:hypothetical protein [Salmonella enterica]EDL7723248.1 hypothetical protein [Salmonella enterica subsp. enterica serovar Give]
MLHCGGDILLQPLRVRHVRQRRKLILERSAKCVQRIKCHDEPPLQLLRMRKRGYSNTEI